MNRIFARKVARTKAIQDKDLDKVGGGWLLKTTCDQTDGGDVTTGTEYSSCGASDGNPCDLDFHMQD